MSHGFSACSASSAFNVCCFSAGLIGQSSAAEGGIRLATHIPEESGMAKNDEKMTRGILGDIDPTPAAHDEVRRPGPADPRDSGAADESMAGGSRHDRTEHAGSRDVTEGVTGGTGTEVGGTRNYRQGTGNTSGDIGNRPE
jgi:hypothetical protein